MKFGETEIRREEGDLRLLEVGCRDDRTAYCVTGEGITSHYDDYDDALEEFNLRWMKSRYGESD